ncbi:ROK family protein [Bifidobacterium dolichotidis]|uniref:ROK family protein n=1 Tax=Bifidobacterium dolichotidis TaxID=2306976 RepID=UPI001F49D196|nr:ROK family protein [Bifidobacterium dolichotidis]
MTSLLLQCGILSEGRPSFNATYGRPSTPLTINRGIVCGIGIQVNADGYGIIAIDLDGTILAEQWRGADLHLADPRYIFSDIEYMLREQEDVLRLHGYLIAGTCMALPGLVTDGRVLVEARNLNWRNLDLSTVPFVNRMHVLAGNSASMAAVSQIPGYATPIQPDMPLNSNSSFIYVSSDVGIGGALVRNGVLIKGDHGYAGELGHLSVDLHGPKCVCGRNGCLEAIAGRRSMIKLAGVAEGVEAASLESYNEFLQLAQQGQPEVIKTLDQGAEAMASALASVVNLSDIDTIVVDGVWANVAGNYLQKIQDMIQQQILARNNVQVKVMSVYGRVRPAIIGAALTGLHGFLDTPTKYMIPPIIL